MKILFVENHARFASVTAKTFLASHVVTIVPSIAAAQEALSNAAFDIILVDYDLDDGKGDAFIEAIRPDNRAFIIAISSHDEGNNRLRQAGADVVCSKMNFSRLAEIIAARNERTPE